MNKWGILLKTEKAQTKIIESLLKNTLGIELSILIPMILGRLIINLGGNRPVIAITFSVAGGFFVYITLQNMIRQVKIHMKKLYDYIYLSLTIMEDRKEELNFVGERKEDKEEISLDELLEHVPFID